MQEIWKPIPGIPNYSASSLGNIRREVSKGCKSQRILKLYVDRKGYLYCSPSINGKPTTLRVHRLVALAFLGDSNGLTVNHKDLNKQNNAIGNLEFMTSVDNLKHANENDRFSLSGAKLTYDDAAFIRSLHSSGHSSKELAERFSVSSRTINRIASFEFWSRPIQQIP